MVWVLFSSRAIYFLIYFFLNSTIFASCRDREFLVTSLPIFYPLLLCQASLLLKNKSKLFDIWWDLPADNSIRGQVNCYNNFFLIYVNNFYECVQLHPWVHLILPKNVNWTAVASDMLGSSVVILPLLFNMRSRVRWTHYKVIKNRNNILAGLKKKKN